MHTIELIVRMETFFGGIIEPNNITSNECRFEVVEELENNLSLLEISSENKDILDRIEELYSDYDYSIPFVSEQEVEIEVMKKDTLAGMEATTEVFELVLMQDELIYMMQDTIDSFNEKIEVLEASNAAMLAEIEKLKSKE